MIIQETYGLTEFNSIFELPIYRLTNEQFEKELNHIVTKSIPYTRQSMIEQNPKKGDFVYQDVWDNIKSFKEYNWKFNEIIGWVTLHLNHETVFGEIFLKKTARINKNSKAKISFYDCGFKIPYNQTVSNQEIFKQILDNISEVQKRKKFLNRYIDISKLETLGLFIDWKKLYSHLNKY